MVRFYCLLGLFLFFFIIEIKEAYIYYLEGANGLNKKATTEALFYLGFNPTPLNLKEYWDLNRKDGKFIK